MSKAYYDRLKPISFVLRVVTPVNIGDGTSLSPIEYLYNYKENTVMLLHQLEWHQYLKRKRLLAEYEKYLTYLKSKPIPLYDWLTRLLSRHDFSEIQLGLAVRAKIKANSQEYSSDSKKSLNTFQTCLRSVSGDVYIPGSSIKGVIRTAILYHLLKQDKKTCEELKKEINKLINSNYRGNISGKLNAISRSYEEKLLHKKVTEESAGRTIEINQLLFRGISCSDAISKNKTTTQVLQKVDLLLSGNKIVRYLPLFRESILGGSEFHFTITLDMKLMKLFGIQSGQQLIDIVEDYTKSINSLLFGAFKESHSAVFQTLKDMNMYIGNNTGFLHKTLFAALYDKPEDIVTITKRILKERDKGIDFKHELDSIISPRTLKATKIDGQLVLTGGVKISVEDK